LKRLWDLFPNFGSMAIPLNDIFEGENVASIQQFFETATAGHAFVESPWVRQRILPRHPNAHKGDLGHMLLVAGSEGKTGAAILSAKAALRTGCGLLTAAIPAAAQTALLTVLPEAMVFVRQNTLDLPAGRYDAIGFGPGAGLDTGNMLHSLLTAQPCPLVIDADGLTILSKNRSWYDLLGASMILTPHVGEFDRLTQPHHSTLSRCQTQLAFSKKYGVHVLLKGRYTTVSTPGGYLYINTTGNNGMATAGSGDVLTGIIGSLLAQGYDTADAAALGAYLHGYAGDCAAKKRSRTSLIASDIIEGISDFFLDFEKNV